MFSKVMDATNGWYAVTEIAQPKNNVENNDKEDDSPIPTVPFKETDVSMDFV